MKSHRRGNGSTLLGTLLSSMLLMAMCGPTEAGAEEPKTADELVAKHIEALGGRKKLDAVKTMRITGKSSFGKGSIENPTVIEFKRPGKVRIEASHKGATAVQTCDGTTGWFTMSSADKAAPAKKMPQAVIELTKEQADFRGALVDYGNKGYRIELAGKAEVNGSECYRLKVTKAGGVVEHYFLDAESFLVVQIKGKRRFRGSENEYTVTLGDYRDVEGLQVAHSIQGGPLTGDMIVQKAEINVELPDERFGKP